MNFVKPLQDLGLTDMFLDKANFKNMSNNPLKISFVIQDAIIEVDETGTAAAAATAAGTAFGSAPPSTAVIFNANHPFLFYIVDSKTGLILFMGKVEHP